MKKTMVRLRHLKNQQNDGFDLLRYEIVPLTQLRRIERKINIATKYPDLSRINIWYL